MNADAFVTALELPTESRVEQRVAKKLLFENGAPTAADKRQINEGIEELLWLATLKPTTIGVSEYRDESREYLEIVVLHLTLRAKAKMSRLVVLVHRAVPYPVLLLSEQDARVNVSLSPISAGRRTRWARPCLKMRFLPSTGMPGGMEFTGRRFVERYLLVGNPPARSIRCIKDGLIHCWRSESHE